MRIKKTPQTKRGVYIYSYFDAETGTSRQLTLRPGVDGVTEAYIKRLHSLDDNEVYYNLKNAHADLTKRQIEEIKKWKDSHPGEDSPGVWNISLNALAYQEGGDSDKSEVLAQAYYNANPEESAEIERLHEVIETMTNKQKEVYRLIVLEGRSVTDTATAVGTSAANVSLHMKAIRKYIKKNF